MPALIAASGFASAGSRVKTVTLMTTLLDPIRYPAGEIAEVYRLQWREEMCFDDLKKTTLHRAPIKYLSPQMVSKEVCLFLNAHNLLRCLIAQATAQARINIEPISFKGTLDGFRHCSVAMAQAKSKATRIAGQSRYKDPMSRNERRRHATKRRAALIYAPFPLQG